MRGMLRSRVGFHEQVRQRRKPTPVPELAGVGWHSVRGFWVTARVPE